MAHPIAVAILALASVFAAAPAFAQDPHHPEGGPDEAKEAIEKALPGQETPEQILRRIGATLTRVEELLARVSFGVEAGTAQKQVVDDLDKLLEETGKEQRQVMEDIDQLIRLAKRVGKSGCFSPKSLSENPQPDDQQQQQQQQSRSDPEMERMKPDNSRESGEPESPDESRNPVTSDTKPKDPQGERTWSEDQSGVWGFLPRAIFDYIFQGDPSKFPPQYREMLEEYYKRLSDKDR
jgi:hypothetical protein